MSFTELHTFRFRCDGEEKEHTASQRDVQAVDVQDAARQLEDNWGWSVIKGNEWPLRTFCPFHHSMAEEAL